MGELVYGVFKPEAVAYFQRVIERLKREVTAMPWCSAAPKSR